MTSCPVTGKVWGIPYGRPSGWKTICVNHVWIPNLLTAMGPSPKWDIPQDGHFVEFLILLNYSTVIYHHLTNPMILY